MPDDSEPDDDVTTAVRILPFGERALLAEVASLAEVLDLHARLAASRPAGVVDLVPAARTVLVRVDPAVLSVAAARAWIGAAAVADTATDAGSPPPLVELPVIYDGDDLAEVAAHLGVSTEEVAARHAAAEWTVAFTGFAPGFGYLVSPDWTVEVPRRRSPRTRVPAGAVGLAGEFTGAYPRETPGGWQLIGTTTASLFDPDAATPALLAPGTRVRFTPASRPPAAPTAAPVAPTAAPAPTAGSAPTAAPAPAAAAPAAAAPAIRILDPGPRATIQDQGRPGHAAEGLAVAGAADRTALRTALRLVGTAEDAAGIEITMGGFRAVALADLWIAVTGAWGAIEVDGRAVDPYVAHAWPAATELRIDVFAHGARGYLAARGGWDAPRLAGSRSSDTLAGVGPAPLRAGDELALAADAVSPIPADDLHPWSAPPDDTIELDLAPGPRADWFTAAAHASLFDSVWTVSSQADRVGIRLEGPELARAVPVDTAVPGELASEGMVPGALQVPPSGRPVILGPDGPVTGGYPVIAVVTDASRDALAQARAGMRVRFRHAR